MNNAKSSGNANDGHSDSVTVKTKSTGPWNSLSASVLSGTPLQLLLVIGCEVMFACETNMLEFSPLKQKAIIRRYLKSILNTGAS